MPGYSDDRIECTDRDIRVRSYYFPWGTKSIPYDSIRSLERVALTTVRGKGRLWGSGDLRHWWNLDPGRPHKSVGFFVHRGGRVVPALTPDDPDAFESVVGQHLDRSAP